MRKMIIIFSFILFSIIGNANTNNLNIEFSNLAQSRSDYSIHNKVIKLLEQAAPKSAVRINLYFLSYIPVAYAISSARQRGVDVKVIIDKASQSFKAYQILEKSLNSASLCPEGKCLVVCGRGVRNLKFSGACIGRRNNHNKFFLFEKLINGESHVVVQTSSNMDIGNKWNDLIQINENKNLYQSYLKYWQISKKEKKMRSYTHIHRDQHVEAYFFPRASGDPIIDILNRVDCSQGGSIRIAQSRFTKDRARVAKKLMDLKRQGCELDLLVALNPKRGSPGRNILHILGENMKIVKGLHSKFFAIDAVLDGKRQKFIITGSHNLNRNSLRNNDESLIVVKDIFAFDAYFNYWDVLKTNLVQIR